MRYKKSAAFLFYFEEERRTIVCFLFLLFFSATSFGQSYFNFDTKVKTSDSNTLTYHIFLTVNLDGSAEGRIAFKDVDGKTKLVIQNFIDSSSFTALPGNDSIKYLSPNDTAKNVDGSYNISFIKTRFQFRKQTVDNNIFYVPVSIDYSFDGSKWIAATTTLNKQKTYAELSKQPKFVNIFFSKADPFYKYLFNPDTRGLNSVEKQTKLFLIAVANTQDSIIGITCKKDLDKVTNLFTTMTANLGIQLLTKTISSAALNKDAVNDAVNNWLKPSSKDIVVFYYTGHGFRFSPDISKYPRMSFRINGVGDIEKNNLQLEDVYNRILNKGARVNIVLSDCCNEDIGLPPSTGLLPLTTRDVGVAGQNLNFDNCRALFFPNHPLSVISAAAQKGQRSVGNPQLGGFFTNFLLEELNKTLYSTGGSTLWLQLLLNAQEKTRRQALTGMCDDINHRCVQRSELDVEPKF